MSQLYQTHIRTDVCSERHSDIKSVRVNMNVVYVTKHAKWGPI